MVSRINRIGENPQRIWVSKLRDLAGAGAASWQSEQERSPAIEPVCSGPALQRRGVPIQDKRTASRLESAPLWLEVIDLLVLIVNPDAIVVRPFQPREIGRQQVLVTTKQERATVLAFPGSPS